MPKKGRRTGRKNGGGMDQVVEVPFRTFAEVSFPDSAGVTLGEFSMTGPNLGTRAAAVATTFEFFRIKTLKAYMYCHSFATIYDSTPQKVGQIGCHHAFAYIDSNDVRTTAATTFTQMVQYEKFVAGGCYERLRMNISKRLLSAEPYKWYNTSSGGAPTDSLAPGMFILFAGTDISTNNAGKSTLIIEGVVEFRGMITPALQLSKQEEDLGTHSDWADIVDQVKPTSEYLEQLKRDIERIQQTYSSRCSSTPASKSGVSS